MPKYHVWLEDDDGEMMSTLREYKSETPQGAAIKGYKNILELYPEDDKATFAVREKGKEEIMRYEVVVKIERKYTCRKVEHEKIGRGKL